MVRVQALVLVLVVREQVLRHRQRALRVQRQLRVQVPQRPRVRVVLARVVRAQVRVLAVRARVVRVLAVLAQVLPLAVRVPVVRAQVVRDPAPSADLLSRQSFSAAMAGTTRSSSAAPMCEPAPKSR